MQVSLDGATPEVNDAVRGAGTYDAALRALRNLRDAGMTDTKLSVVCTRENIPQLDRFKEIADEHGAVLRLTRLRPAGRGADVWNDLHPLARAAARPLRLARRARRRRPHRRLVLPPAAFGDALPGLNLCGAGRVVCLVDPVGDVYACPFAIHDRFLAGNVRARAGFGSVWRDAPLFADLRSPQTGGACTRCSAYDACRGGCMAAKFFTGLPLDGRTRSASRATPRPPSPRSPDGVRPRRARTTATGPRPQRAGPRDHRPPPPGLAVRREPAGSGPGRALPAG